MSETDNGWKQCRNCGHWIQQVTVPDSGPYKIGDPMRPDKQIWIHQPGIGVFCPPYKFGSNEGGKEVATPLGEGETVLYPR